MDTAPDDDPLRKFLSGKRRSERRSCDIPVEVRGSGVGFTGRAIDVSEGGALIWLDDASLESVQPGMGVIEALGVVDRYFSNGAQVVFLAQSLLLPSSVVRLTTPKDGSGVHIGCRFERALTPDESTRLLTPKPPVSLDPLELAPKAGVDVYLYLLPQNTITAGPLYIAKMTGLDGALADVRIEPTRPVKADDVQGELASGPIVGRIMIGGQPLFEGPIAILSVKPGISRTPVIDVRVESPTAFPSSVRKRFGKRRH